MALPSWLDDLLSGPQVYASPLGDDNNPGTLALPKRTVAGGLAVLPKEGGGRVNLRGGAYVENVQVSCYTGRWWRPVVIRSVPGELAFIDGSVAEFREIGNNDWSPVPDHPDEFVSKVLYPRTLKGDEHAESVDRGAFIDRVPYTRLITYSRLEDLRSPNESFEPIWDGDVRDGEAVVPCEPVPDADDTNEDVENVDDQPVGLGTERRPWVYMGPGIYFDETSRQVHIRLSHTSNAIDGLPDYLGETDPANVRLALSAHRDVSLRIENSTNVRVKNVTLRFGGEHTVVVKDSTDVVFDNVRILAASRAVRLSEGNTRTVFRHCEMRGGWPTWFFRSDRKDEYCFRDGATAVHNELGKHTSAVIFSGGGTNVGTEVHHCEFIDAHDLYMFGTGMRFHHNWVHNLNDDAIVLNAVVPTVDARVWQNVITRCLTGISYGNRTNVSDQCSVYRNLIDLRRPTAGIRPRKPGKKEVWRQGSFYKSQNVDGPLDLFHNTALVLAAGSTLSSKLNMTRAGFTHYGHQADGNHVNGRLRSFNNVLVAVMPAGLPDKHAAFLPSDLFPGPTDGNCYFRTGHAPPWEAKLLRVDAFRDPSDTVLPIAHLAEAHEYDSLKKYRDSPEFELSKAQYAPGYEAASIDVDPLFRAWQDGGVPDEEDDLRLSSPASPARRQGVELPDDLDELDPLSLSWLPRFARPKPDMGCYGMFGVPLAVGVEGRRRFPHAAN